MRRENLWQTRMFSCEKCSKAGKKTVSLSSKFCHGNKFIYQTDV